MMDEIMTLTEFAEEYERQEKEVLAIDRTSLSARDSKLLAEFDKNRQFLDGLKDSLEFTRNSTVVVPRTENGERVLALETKTTVEEYASAMIVLTDNFNEKFKNFLQRDMDSFDRVMINKQDETVMSYKVVKDAIAKMQAQRKAQELEITVREAQEMQRRIAEQVYNAEQYYIQQKYQEEKYQQEKMLQEQMAQQEKAQQEKAQQEKPAYSKMLTVAAATVVAAEVIDKIKDSKKDPEKELADKPIEIVEGNDGILNTSDPNEIAPSKVGEIQARINEKKESINAAFKKGDKGNREDSDKNKAVKQDKLNETKKQERSRKPMSR